MAMEIGEQRLIAERMTAISALHPSFVTLIDRQRATLDALPAAVQEALSRSPDQLRLLVSHNLSIKLRLLLEQCPFVSTLLVLSWARYAFESIVWLRLLKDDMRFAAVFYAELIEQRRKHEEKAKSRLSFECEYFDKLYAREREALVRVERGDAIRHLSEAREIAEDIDAEAARHFLVHHRGAKTNGYGFHAHLLRVRGIPQFDSRIQAIKSEADAFKNGLSNSLLQFVNANKRLNWRDKAEKVGLLEEYNFIYAYCSSLLHATPASILTEEKNLEWGEMRMFLDFLYVTYRDALALMDQFQSDWVAASCQPHQ